MMIEWLGHSAFVITSSSNTTVMTDPYESGSYSGEVKYETPRVSPDIITISHSHPDHNFTGCASTATQIIRKTGTTSVGDIHIKGIRSFHDKQKGSARGENIIFSIMIDGINVVHLGDLCHALDTDVLRSLGPIDVALIPVGGIFTLDANEAHSFIIAAHPSVAIPMHYKTEKIGFGIESVDAFVRTTRYPVIKHSDSTLALTAELLDKKTKTIVLKYTH